MKLENILKTINQIRYENLEEVIVPTQHLVDLRATVLNLQHRLKEEQKEHKKCRAEALAILAKQHLTPRFEEYA